MDTNKNEYHFNALGLIVFLWKKKIPIISITLLTIITSIIVSLLIDDKYKSEVIVFPTASGSVSQDLLSTSYSNKSLLRLGEDEEIDQLLQILNSDEVRNRVIEEFDLENHYEIKSKEKYKRTKLYKKFEENITFEPTKFISVRIAVMDKDPQIAADIANRITELIDTVSVGMQKEKAMEAYHLVKNQLEETNKEIQELEDSLRVIRGLGIGDYSAQIERYSEALGKALLSNNQTAADKIEKKMDNLNLYGGFYDELTENIAVLRKQKGLLLGKYAEAKLDAFQTLPHKYVVNKAIVAEKKAYPKRSIIVILSAFAAFVFSVILLLIVDTIKKIPEIKF